AVVNEGDGALAQVLHVAAGGGGGIEQRGWFVLFIFQEDRRRGRFVGNRLPADFDAVFGDRGFFLGGRSRSSFGWLLGRFDIFFLRVNRRAKCGHGQSERQQGGQVFHTDHHSSPRNKLVFRGSVKLRFYLFIRAPNYFVRRPMSRNSSLAGEESRKSLAQLSTIQSAPACWSSPSPAVVRRATTRAPAPLPARIPEGASSMTMHSLAETSRSCAPFR